MVVMKCWRAVRERLSPSIPIACLPGSWTDDGSAIAALLPEQTNSGPKSLCQLLNAAPQLSDVDGCKAQHQSILSGSAGGVTAERNSFDPASLGLSSSLLGTHSIFQPSHRLQPGFDARDLHHSGQFRTCSLQQNR